MRRAKLGSELPTHPTTTRFGGSDSAPTASSPHSCPEIYNVYVYIYIYIYIYTHLYIYSYIQIY